MSELVLTEKEVEFIVDSIGDKIGHYSSLNQHVHKSIIRQMLCTSLDVIKEEREDGKKCIE
jgi:hypothetical protein